MWANMNNSKPWAVVRLVLGSFQVSTATLAFVLLIRSGVNDFSVGATLFATILTLTSILLFRGKKQ